MLLKLWKSLRMARAIVRNFRPDIAIGVGGYASGPTLKAAQRAGVPTLLQEQNSYAGVTNKLLARRARRICTAYPGMERFFPADRITLTGNPVRKELPDCTADAAAARAALGFDPGTPLVLFVGGSLGALTINNAVAEAVESGKMAEAPFSVLWQTGKNESRRCMKIAETVGADKLKAKPFINDMAMAYAAADLVVARAGAGTISELQLLGKAAVLVPSPNVAEDHQRRNAEALTSRDAAVMVLDADAATDLWATVTRLMQNPQERHMLSRNIHGMALENSDEKIADEIDKILQNGTQRN